MEDDIHMEGQIEGGTEVVLYVEQEASLSYVSIESPAIGYIQFNFNPDFPQDAKRFYEAIMLVKSMSIE